MRGAAHWQGPWFPSLSSGPTAGSVWFCQETQWLQCHCAKLAGLLVSLQGQRWLLEGELGDPDARDSSEGQHDQRSGQSHGTCHLTS